MKLSGYDGRCVRILDRFGDTFDGVCTYNGAEYDEHEFGRAEESLQIESFLFYKSDIESVRVLEDEGGAFGRFRDPYGKLEELTVADGMDAIRDALESDEPEHVRRLLRCLRAHLASSDTLPETSSDASPSITLDRAALRTALEPLLTASDPATKTEAESTLALL